uniref:Zinc ion binding protein n=1 Tax=Chenopodium quinoa TaxID=63459 RepID=A0A803LQ41_CHEQI
MQLGDLNKVWETRALKRKPRQDEAKQILERIAKQKFTYWPCSPKRNELLGLNVNRGVEVKLRLRRPDRELEFYSFHEVLDTMLHELCHNAHGPHNASFYQLWDQLRKECEELMSNGISGTGEGFDLPGKRLGGFSRQPPLASLHKTAVAAAENRKRLNSLLPSGPLRLGGDKNIMSALSPVQAAAMAAERRLQDEIWCASVSGGFAEDLGDSDLLETGGPCGPAAASANTSDSNNASWNRSQNDVTNLIDLSNNVNSTSTNFHNTTSSKRSIGSHASSSASASSNSNNVSGAAASRKRSWNCDITNLIDLSNDENSASVDAYGAKLNKGSIGSNASSSSVSMSASSSGLTTNLDAGNTHGESATWTCETCTLLNPPLALVCEACETLKPKDISVKYKFWSCKFCTLENSVKLEKCSACGEWRYSRGPPLSSLPPNLGT